MPPDRCDMARERKVEHTISMPDGVIGENLGYDTHSQKG